MLLSDWWSEVSASVVLSLEVTRVRGRDCTGYPSMLVYDRNYFETACPHLLEKSDLLQKMLSIVLVPGVLVGGALLW